MVMLLSFIILMIFFILIWRGIDVLFFATDRRQEIWRTCDNASREDANDMLRSSDEQIAGFLLQDGVARNQTEAMELARYSKAQCQRRIGYLNRK